MLPLEYDPGVEYLLGEPVVSSLHVESEFPFMQFKSLLVLDALNIEIKGFSAEPKSEPSSYQKCTMLFFLEAGHFVAPSADSYGFQSCLKGAHALVKMLLPFLIKFISLITIFVSECNNLVLQSSLLSL